MMTQEEFLQAIEAGNITAVKEYISHTNNINFQFPLGFGQTTPLLTALSGNNVEMVELLLDNWANPDAKGVNSSGLILFPLHLVVNRYADEPHNRDLLFQYAQALCKKHVKVDAVDAYQTTALMKLSIKNEYKSIRMIELLIQHGATVTKTNHMGYSAPDFAAANANEELVEYFLPYEGSYSNNRVLFDIMRKHAGEGKSSISDAYINIFKKILSENPRLIEMKAKDILDVVDGMTLRLYAEWAGLKEVVNLIDEITKSKNKPTLETQGQGNARPSNNARALYVLGFLLLVGAAVMSYFAPQATGLGSILGYAIGAGTMAACAAASVLKASSTQGNDTPLVFSKEMSVVSTSPSLMSNDKLESNYNNNNNNQEQQSKPKITSCFPGLF